MPLARTAALSRGLSRTVLRRAGSSTRNRSWRQIGRRGYASDHGHQESSEIPWIIGSAAFFIPSAAWLLGQAPAKGGHGHDSHHEEKHDEVAEDVEAKEAEQDDEPKEESDEEQKKEESEDKERVESEEKDEADGESKDESEDKGEEDAKGSSSGAPKQTNGDSSKSKGPGEGQKGERKPSQKGEKDAQGDFSGAQHPYIDDAEKSKKGIGVTETAKIHGTVDPKAPAR